MTNSKKRGGGRVKRRIDSLTKNKEFIQGKHTCIIERHKEHKSRFCRGGIHWNRNCRTKIILIVFILEKYTESKQNQPLVAIVFSFLSPDHIGINKPARF